MVPLVVGILAHVTLDLGSHNLKSRAAAFVGVRFFKPAVVWVFVGESPKGPQAANVAKLS